MRAYNRTLIFAITALTIGATLGACSPNFPTGAIEKKRRFKSEVQQCSIDGMAE